MYSDSLKEQKRKEAEERQKVWASLSFAEQLKDLDRRLGPDVGAVSQRARIKKKVEKNGWALLIATPPSSTKMENISLDLDHMAKVIDRVERLECAIERAEQKWHLATRSSLQSRVIRSMRAMLAGTTYHAVSVVKIAMESSR